MKSNSVILFIFLQFLVFGNLFCQNESQNDSLKINSLYKGSKSIQFRVTSNFTLSNFNGSNISAKYHFNNKKAIRVGVTLDADKADLESEKLSGGEEYNDNFTKNFSVEINAHFIYYPNVNNRILLFFGIGPDFTYQYTEGNGELLVYKEDTLSYINNSSSEYSEYDVGISLITGVEIFILNYLSIHAEYTSSFSYGYLKRESYSIRDYTDINQPNTGSINHTEDTGYHFRAKQVLFGLSIYL
jgi:hypothetical protein